MDHIKFIPVLWQAILLCTLLMASIIHFCKKFAPNHGAEVRIIWYFFFLAAAFTTVVAAWGSSSGAIDSLGKFQGATGEKLNSLLHFMLDLDADFRIFSALLFLAVFPQLATYTISGLFGCASSPVLIGRSIEIFAWSLIKAFTTAGGILFSFSAYGIIHNWLGWNARGAFAMFLMSLMFLTFALMTADMYIDLKNEARRLEVTSKSTLRGRLTNWMKRNVGKKPL